MVKTKAYYQPIFGAIVGVSIPLIFKEKDWKVIGTLAVIGSCLGLLLAIDNVETFLQDETEN